MAAIQQKLCSAQNDVKCPTTPAYQLVRVDGTQIELDVPWYEWVIPWHEDPARYTPRCLTSLVLGATTEGDCFAGAGDQPGTSTLVFGGLPPGDVTVDETTGVGRMTWDNKDFFLNSCYAKKPQDLDDPSVSQLAIDSIATVRSNSSALTIDQFRARYFPTYECSLSPDNVIDITQPYAEYASRWVALESIALHTVAFVEETAVIGAALAASDGALAGLLAESAWGNSLRTVLLGNGIALFREAEDIPLSDISGNHIPVVHQGASESYSGDGFIDYRGEGYIEWTFDIPASGDDNLTFGYSLASGSRSLDLIVDGSTQATLPFPATGSSAGAWRTPGTQKYSMFLAAGTGGLRLQTRGSSGPNMDYLAIQAAEVALPAQPSWGEDNAFECPAGMAITRAEISHGWNHWGSASSYINGVAFYCGALRANGDVRANIRQDDLGFPAWYGNTNGTETQVRCLSDEFVSGATGKSGGWLDRLGLWCRIGPNFGDSHYISLPIYVGGDGGGELNSYCPNGHVATGAKVGVTSNGYYINHLQLTCTRVQVE